MIHACRIKCVRMSGNMRYMWHATRDRHSASEIYASGGSTTVRASISEPNDYEGGSKNLRGPDRLSCN